MRRFGGRVEFACDRETAFDFLVDPRRRPEWQSSLRRVSEVDGEPRVGQTWVDETKPGIKPRMQTTELDRPSRLLDDEETVLCGAPLDGDVIVLGRRGGPQFLDSELARLGHLLELARTISRPETVRGR